MTQKDNNKDYKKEVSKNLTKIVKRFNQYITLDATLSDETLKQVNSYIEKADNALESGFVKDACDEIDNVLNYS